MIGAVVTSKAGRSAVDRPATVPQNVPLQRFDFPR